MRQQPTVTIAIRAVRQAGKVLLRYLNRLDSLSIVQKSHNDYVSEADHEADRLIVQEIRRAFPTHAILSEESGASGTNEYRWIIDPLDGTHNYVQGFPHFCVSLAVEKRGVLEHAVIYDPLHEEMFTASRGCGAFINDRRIRVGDRRGLEGTMLATGFPFRTKKNFAPCMQILEAIFEPASGLRSTGSAALDLAYVAAGRLDGFWHLGLKPWDLAAGVLLVREAGGACLDFNGGEGFMQSGDVIAGNLKVVAELQRHTQPLHTRPTASSDVRSDSNRSM